MTFYLLVNNGFMAFLQAKAAVCVEPLRAPNSSPERRRVHCTRCPRRCTVHHVQTESCPSEVLSCVSVSIRIIVFQKFHTTLIIPYLYKSRNHNDVIVATGDGLVNDIIGDVQRQYVPLRIRQVHV